MEISCFGEIYVSFCKMICQKKRESCLVLEKSSLKSENCQIAKLPNCQECQECQIAIAIFKIKHKKSTLLRCLNNVVIRIIFLLFRASVLLLQVLVAFVVTMFVAVFLHSATSPRSVLFSILCPLSSRVYCLKMGVIYILGFPFLS